jgi:hypothetical protein
VRSGRPPAVIGSNPVFAIVPKTKLVPRPAGTPDYPALSTAIYQNVNGALAGSATPASAAVGHAVRGEHRAQQHLGGGL